MQSETVLSTVPSPSKSMLIVASATGVTQTTLLGPVVTTIVGASITPTNQGLVSELVLGNQRMAPIENLTISKVAFVALCYGQGEEQSSPSPVKNLAPEPSGIVDLMTPIFQAIDRKRTWRATTDKVIVNGNV